MEFHYNGSLFLLGYNPSYPHNRPDGREFYTVNDLAVNEQNPLARGFYEHMGFEVYKRTEYDEQGSPYPLLYMRIRNCCRQGMNQKKQVQ